MRWGGPAEKRLAGSAALNPQSLPYFAPPEATANPGTALLYLDRQRAVLRRAHSPSAVVHTVATSAYRGVAVRISPQGASGEIEAVVELYHRDPSLRVRLARNEDPSAIAADWQGWGEALALPLLFVDRDGTVTEHSEQPMPLPIGSHPRRRRGGRRPRFLQRRKVGIGPVEPRLSAREIIARD
ncbi:MAG: DUF6101 family protein [Bauldia sp.]